MEDDPWAEYARLQKIAGSPTLNDKAWAIDEALDAILDKIETGQPLLRHQADNLVINRAAKFRRRRACLNKNTDVLVASSPSEESRLLARCHLSPCAGNCSIRDWKILVSIGLGETYNDIAEGYGVAEGTIKTWVRRARMRLAA